MTALTWIRSKAAKVETDTLSTEDGTYTVDRYYFRGFVPARMARELRASKLEKTDTINETIHVQVKDGRCEFWRNIYTLGAGA